MTPNHGPGGASPSRYNKGCRCDDCRRINRERLARFRERSTGPRVHGTPSSYSNHGCRCAECSAAWRVRMAREYAARKARLADGTAPVIHGRYSTYTGWGCRCPECSAACREYKARRRLRAAGK